MFFYLKIFFLKLLNLSLLYVLKNHISMRGTILEVASGSGEHAVAFQSCFPECIWQASDPNPTYRKSISAWIEYEGLNDVMPKPLDLDVEQLPWRISAAISSDINVIVCINMLHVSPWSSTKGLFRGAEACLAKGCTLFLYGPFKTHGQHTSQSNIFFDELIREKNKDWGIRNIEDVEELAHEFRFKMSFLIDMPANNFSAIFSKY